MRIRKRNQVKYRSYIKLTVNLSETICIKTKYSITWYFFAHPHSIKRYIKTSPLLFVVTFCYKLITVLRTLSRYT